MIRLNGGKLITKDNVKFYYKWSGKDTLVHIVAEFSDGTCEVFAESDSIKNYTTKFDNEQHNKLCDQAFNRLILNKNNRRNYFSMNETEDKNRALEANIISEAKAQLKQLHGINSICVDSLKHDTSGTFEERVERLVCDTLYWEGKIK